MGFTKKTIDSNYDFDIEIPKTENKNWTALLETLRIAGTTETARKGWIGLAFSSVQKPNDGWACMKLTKG